MDPFLALTLGLVLAVLAAMVLLHRQRLRRRYLRMHPLLKDPPAPLPDREQFLAGARQAFTRIMESYSRGDLEDVGRFTTPAMHREFFHRSVQSPPGEALQVAEVTAELPTDTPERDENLERIWVVYKATMTAQRAGERTVVARWSFVRDLLEDGGPTWRLEEITLTQ